MRSAERPAHRPNHHPATQFIAPGHVTRGPLLDRLLDGPDLYVRRSVANHLGDIAKRHPELAFDRCEGCLSDASKERNWVVCHAVRHPAKQGVASALALRRRAE